MRTDFRKLTTAAALAASALAALPASAALVPSECQGAADTASCGLQSLVNVFVLFANYIFGIAGSLAFVFFIYGGYVWLSSAGSSEKINKGKTIVVNAIIGLVLVFGARGLVTLVVQAVTKGSTVPIENASCKPDTPLPSSSPIKPRWVRDTDDQFQCVSSCDQLKDATGKKYECMDPAGATDCVSNLCDGGADNVCCTKPFAGTQSCVCETAYGSFNLPLPGTTDSCASVTCAYSEGSHYCACGQARLDYSDLIATQFTEEEFAAYCRSITNCRNE